MKKICYYSISFLLVLLSTALLLRAQSAEMAESYLRYCENGTEAWRNKDYNKAFRNYEAALSREASFSEEFKTTSSFKNVQAKLDAMNVELEGGYEKAKTLYHDRKYTDAIALIEPLLDLDFDLAKLSPRMKYAYSSGALHFYLGFSYYYKNDNQKAFAYLYESALKGQSEAAYYAAQMIADKDDKAREALFVLAASQGHKAATDSTIAICFRQKDYDVTLEWIEKAESHFSHYIHARICLDRFQDASAFEYAQKAYSGAGKNDMHYAQYAYLLGLLYDNGIGVEADHKKGLKLLKEGDRAFRYRD